MTRGRRLAVLWLMLLSIYLPALGHGFIKDDFRWIAEARAREFSVLTDTGGFYRPVVALSFELDGRLFGLNPRGYALTNLVLVFAITLAIADTGRRLGLTPVAADLSAGTAGGTRL